MTNNSDILRVDGPNHIALVDGVDGGNLCADKTCRVRTVEEMRGDARHTLYCLGQFLTGTEGDMQFAFCEQANDFETFGKLFLTALHHKVVVRSQRSGIESRDENGLGADVGASHSAEGALTNSGPETCLEQGFLDTFGIGKFAIKMRTRHGIFLSLDHHSEECAFFATHYCGDLSADRRSEADASVLLFTKQG